MCECLFRYKLKGNVEYHLIYTHLIDLCYKGAEELYSNLYHSEYAKYIYIYIYVYMIKIDISPERET